MKKASDTRRDNAETFDASYDGAEQGASLMEYALLASLIAVVCIASLFFLGSSASTTFTTNASAMATARGS